VVHDGKNVGKSKAVVLATYVVEKGKPGRDSDQVTPRSSGRRAPCARRFGSFRRVRARAPRLRRGMPMAALAPDPVAFRALEHAGWQGAARHYDDAFEASPAGGRAAARLGLKCALAHARSTWRAARARGAAAAARGRVSRRWIFPPRCGARALAESGNRVPEGEAEALPFRRQLARGDELGMLQLVQPERAVAEASAFCARAQVRFHGLGDRRRRWFGSSSMRSEARQSRCAAAAGPPFFRFSDARSATRSSRSRGQGRGRAKGPAGLALHASGLLFERSRRSVRTQALLHAQSAPGLNADPRRVRQGRWPNTRITDRGDPMPAGSRSAGSRDPAALRSPERKIMKRPGKWLAPHKAIEIVEEGGVRVLQIAATRSRARSPGRARPDRARLRARDEWSFCSFVRVSASAHGGPRRGLDGALHPSAHAADAVTVVEINPGVVTVARDTFTFPKRTRA